MTIDFDAIKAQSRKDKEAAQRLAPRKGSRIHMMIGGVPGYRPLVLGIHGGKVALQFSGNWYNGEYPASYVEQRLLPD